MKATTHGDYLTKVTRLWVVNMYLVREEDGLTLIDSGFSGSAVRASSRRPRKWAGQSAASR